MTNKGGKGGTIVAEDLCVQRRSTGTDGIDYVLGGGLPSGRVHLLQGRPGTGKTTLALQFLRTAVAAGERVLYVGLSESEQELRAVAAGHGWSLDGIEILEVPSIDRLPDDRRTQTVFHTAEIELGETMRELLGAVQRVQPTCAVVDSLTELRLLADDDLRFRRQLLLLKQAFTEIGCTTLLLHEGAHESPQTALWSVVHGILVIDQRAAEYGPDQRHLRVVKMRGIPFHAGQHDMAIQTGGAAVYPRLVVGQRRRPDALKVLRSGLRGLDDMLGGGLDAGTSTLLVGPAGIGKSSVAMQFVLGALRRGEPVGMYLFDERLQTLLTRSRSMGMPLEEHLDSGLLDLRQIDPAELSPGEFAHAVRHGVEQGGHQLVLIDSLSGYTSAMAAERFLLLQLHQLISYLGEKGVSSILVYGQPGLFAPATGLVEASYLADSVILFRYFEHDGAVRQAISIFKRRGGVHERTIRELSFSAEGVQIGPPLKGFRGVLSGNPLTFRDGMMHEVE